MRLAAPTNRFQRTRLVAFVASNLHQQQLGNGGGDFDGLKGWVGAFQDPGAASKWEGWQWVTGEAIAQDDGVWGHLEPSDRPREYQYGYYGSYLADRIPFEEEQSRD